MLEFREVTRPYPGLRPFESWEGEIFFGRESHTDRLLEILQDQRFLAVIGPSGSGKSSLVRAGLLPALPLGSLGTGSDWRVALLRPGNRPMQRLAHALLGRSALGVELVGEERVPQNGRHITADVALIEAELRRGPLGLIEVVKDARKRRDAAPKLENPRPSGEGRVRGSTEDPTARDIEGERPVLNPPHPRPLPQGEGESDPFNLLVLVDQFEEIFTYADAGGRQADESEAFVNLLLASKAAKDAHIYIVLTMRTDFLGNCVRFLELPDAINRAQYLTPRLTREQIEKAITGPAHLFDGDVEPTLVAELINAVSNDPDQLPILQHALARMWESAQAHDRHTGMDCRYPENRDVDSAALHGSWVPAIPAGTTGQNHIGWDDFKTVGGIHEALSKHADEVLASLSLKKVIEDPLGPEQRTAEILFRAITEQRDAVAGGQAVRRPQSLQQIGDWSGRKAEEFFPVVRAFAKEGVNFLTYVGELNAETVVDISHEALIRQWGRLREWVADEARLAGEYRRWRERAEAKAAGTGALLTGADLVRAVEWRDGAAWNTQSFCKPGPAWASRYRNTADQRSDSEFKGVLKFIDESQQVVLKEEQRQRRINRNLRISTVVSVVAFVLAAGFAIYANQQKVAAHEKQIAAEASVLWHPLDFSDSRIEINPKQTEGLLRLALSDDEHKKAFLEQLLREEALAGWFNHKSASILSASIGLNRELRSWFLERLYEIAPENETKDVFRVACVLALMGLGGEPTPEGIIAAVRGTQNADQLESLAKGLVAVAGKVPEAQAVAVAEQLVTAIRELEDDDQLYALGQGLAALPVKLTETQAVAVIEQLMGTFQITDDSDQLQSRRQVLGVVAGQLSEVQAGAVADKFVATIRETEDPDQLGSVSEGLAALPIKLSDAQAEAVADKFVAAIRGNEDRYPLKVYKEDLNRGLAAVTGKLSQAQAEAVADKVVAAIRGTGNANKLLHFSQGFVAVAGTVPEAQAGAVTEKLVATIRGTQDDYQLHALVDGLAAVAGKVPEAQAGAVAERFVAAIQATGDSDQLAALAQGLAALPVKLTEAQAGAVAERFVAAIQATEGYSQLEALGEGLAAVAGKVTEAQAGPVAERFLAAFQATEDPDQLKALGRGLEAVAGKVSEAQAGAMVGRFLAAIQATGNPDKLEVLAQRLATVASGIAADDKAASLLFELLKNPLIPHDAITDTIRKRFPDAPPKEQGFWALVEWADKQFPHIDLDAPLQEPPAMAVAPGGGS